MVRKERKTISLPKESFTDFQQYYEKYRNRLRRKGIKNFTSFVESSVYYYIETFKEP